MQTNGTSRSATSGPSMRRAAVASVAAASTSLLLASPVMAAEPPPAAVPQAAGAVAAKIAWTTKDAVQVAGIDGKGARKLASLPARLEVEHLSLSPDGAQLLVSSYESTWLINTSTAAVRKVSSDTRTPGYGGSAVSWAPDSTKFAIALVGVATCTVTSASCSTTTFSKGTYAYGVSWSLDGSRQAVLTSKDFSKIRKTKSGKKVRSFTSIGRLIEVGPAGQHVLAKSKGSGSRWESLNPAVATANGWTWTAVGYAKDKYTIKTIQRRADGSNLVLASLSQKRKKRGALGPLFVATGLNSAGELVGTSAKYSDRKASFTVGTLVNGRHTALTSSISAYFRKGKVQHERGLLGQTATDQVAIVENVRDENYELATQKLRFASPGGLGPAIATGKRVSVAVASSSGSQGF